MVAVLQVNPKEGFTLEEAEEYVGGRAHFWDMAFSGLLKPNRMEGKGRTIIYKRTLDAAIARHIAGEPIKQANRADITKLKQQWGSDDD